MRKLVISNNRIMCSHSVDQQIENLYPTAQAIVTGNYDETINPLNISLADLKAGKISLIMAKTEFILATGLEISGVTFSLLEKNQFQYKTVYEMGSDDLEFPYTVRGINNVPLVLNDFAALETWYKTGLAYVETKVQEELSIIDSILLLETASEVLDFTDPR